MAEDCDNQRIVVEESTKESYFQFLDSHARVHIFKSIFNQWALNIPSLAANQNMDPSKVTFLQNRLMDTFLAWIRLSLPDEVFQNLLAENGAMIDLIYSQLGSEEDDNLSVAVNCIVELISFSRVAKYGMTSFQDIVMQKLSSLQEHVHRVIASGDFEKADQFTEIFVEIGKTNMD